MTNINPDRQGRVKKVSTYFSVTAYFMGIMLPSLYTEMIYRYLIPDDSADVPWWFFHTAWTRGSGYMALFVAIVNLGAKTRWEPAERIITALGGAIPFLSFLVEKRRREEVETTSRLK